LILLLDATSWEKLSYLHRLLLSSSLDATARQVQPRPFAIPPQSSPVNNWKSVAYFAAVAKRFSQAIYVYGVGKVREKVIKRWFTGRGIFPYFGNFSSLSHTLNKECGKWGKQSMKHISNGPISQPAS